MTHKPGHKTPKVTGFIKKATQKQAARRGNKSGRIIWLAVATLGAFFLVRSRW